MTDPIQRARAVGDFLFRERFGLRQGGLLGRIAVVGAGDLRAIFRGEAARFDRLRSPAAAGGLVKTPT